MQYNRLPLFALVGTALAQSQTQSLNATLSSNPSLSNLTSFLSLSPELLSVLSRANNLTILAPNNEAFGKLLESSAGQAIGNNSGLIASILQYHILNGSYPASELTNTSTFVPTLLSNEEYANVTGGQVVEGVVVGNETVFYSGLLQNSTVTQADVNFTGGTIHVIDTVLTLPVNVLETASSLNLTSFRGAVNSTNLTSTVNETPDLTIFAPNNEALRSIGSALANLSTTELANILAYHVVNGTIGYSSDLEDGLNLTTANGQNLTISIDDGEVFVNAAKVVTADVLVANGVLHIIDNVLNPSNTTEAADGATTGVPGFPSATAVGTDAPFTSGQPQPSTTINPSSAGSGPAQSSGSGGSSSGDSSAAAMPMMTGAVGYGALLGAGAAVYFG